MSLTMGERESIFRASVITYFPMFIAVLSLVTSIFSSYLSMRSLEFFESSLGRTESLRTCKEIIDAYFQVKFLTSQLSEAGAEAANASSPAAAPARLNATNAVSKFAALGTYLANLRDAAAREHYSELSWKLEEIVRRAATTAPADLEKLFEPADAMFTEMNDDCVKTAKG
jgi:hypothetical protein